ncbi:MAG: Lrp/AsnC family transcriptional regulator [Clostridiales bacterium]|nr:Lrp/AsnC family transcriptional regulator [Clostridiales bacterium]
MDKLQEQVLEIMGEDCRIPLERMAIMLGCELSAVAEAIDGLERDRVILRYRPVVDWDKAHKQRVEAMIEVKVTPQRDHGFDETAKRIYGYPEVRSVYLMSGAYDLLVQVVAPTLKELALFVSSKLSVVDTVTATSTSFVLKRYKQDGVLFAEEKTDQRLVISP